MIKHIVGLLGAVALVSAPVVAQSFPAKAPTEGESDLVAPGILIALLGAAALIGAIIVIDDDDDEPVSA